MPQVAAGRESSHAAGFHKRIKTENQQQNRKAGYHAKTPEAFSRRLLIVLPQLQGNRDSRHGQEQKHNPNQQMEHLLCAGEQDSKKISEVMGSIRSAGYDLF